MYCTGKALKGAMKFLIFFFHDNLCGIEEYIFEHIHSIIRRNTSSSDSVDQLPKKVSGIFASRERQANFRASFTPPKIYVFSRSEIQTIYANVASVIVSIVTAIAARGRTAPCGKWLLCLGQEKI